MMWCIFFARSTGPGDETFSKNRVTNSIYFNHLQDLLRVFCIDY
jgi:hypothetical protein